MLTVVSAPLGYGKTITAKALAKSLGDRAFFVDVPQKPHNTFWLRDLFCTQLETRHSPLTARLRRMDPPESPHQIYAMLKDVACTTPSPVFILDNYHHLSSPIMNQFLASILEMSVPFVRLVLFSRTRPATDFTKTIPENTAAFFGVEQLRFTIDEVRHYFELHGVTEPGIVKKAWDISEGWPAALWLILKNWHDTGDFQIHPDFESVLAKSSLACVSEPERSLLMRLSVMDTFNSAEVKTMGGKKGFEDILSYCEANCILEHDATTDQFRFHPLVRDFLVRQLAASPAINAPVQYHRAGKCSLARGDFLSAFHFFIQAGRDRDLIQALSLFLNPGAEEMFTVSAEEIRASVQTFPKKVIRKNPLGYLAFIRLYLLARSETSIVAWWLVETEADFLERGVIEQTMRNRIRGEMALLSGLLACNTIEVMFTNFDKALSHLHEASCIHPHLLAWGFGCPNISFSSLRDGGTFNDIIRQSAAAGKTLSLLSAGHGDGCADVLQMEYLLERGELDAVKQRLSIFKQDKAGEKHLSPTIQSGFIQARLHLFAGDADAALSALTALRPLVMESKLSGHAQSLSLALDYIHACLGRYEQISDCLVKDDLLSSPQGAMQRHSFLFIVYGKAMLAAGKYRQIETIARNMPLMFMGYDSAFGHIHAKIFEAICLHRLQGTKQALNALRAAVELSRPDGLVFSFAEYGRLLTPLMRGLLREGKNDSHLTRIHALSESVQNHYVKDASTAPGSLTFREQEIMRMMIKGMTNPAIGNELGITGVAVKKTLTLIYEKLGASNRVQASSLYSLYYEQR